MLGASWVVQEVERATLKASDLNSHPDYPHTKLALEAHACNAVLGKGSQLWLKSVSSRFSERGLKNIRWAVIRENT